ncbi:Riboflavin transporter [Aphelenchoides fujianensis]|nr:Riboflavin transporter [Aphelenchoides fujianensis]
MGNVSPIVYLLVVIFGSSSWLSTNSVWLELSLLTQAAAGRMVAALLLGPDCAGEFLLSARTSRFSAPPVIFVLMSVCAIAEFLLAFFWDRTALIFGAAHSVPLMVLIFVMALVNSTSNVLFMPYMAAFHPSLVPSVVSLAQGTSDYTCVRVNGTAHPQYSPARFGVREYTLTMGVWMMIALTAFTVLHFFHENLTRRSTSEETNEQESSPLKGDRNRESAAPTTDGTATVEDRSGTKRYVILLVCLAFICAQMNAVVPSIQSYATMSYSMLAYHLALTLSNLAHPLASFLPMWFQPKGMRSLVVLTVFATIFCSVIVLLAFQSPTPLLHESVFGGVLTVVVSIITAFTHAYLRTVLTSVIRDDAPENENRLFWCGVYMQVGSFLGSLLMFPLVNVAHLFESAPVVLKPCTY